MLTPASTATSPRRNPGTRRAPASGSPAWAGLILARRETRNSRTSARLSMTVTLVTRRPARECPAGTSVRSSHPGAASRTDQHLERLARVHQPVGLGDVGQRELTVEDPARVDGA